jgi:hypothetical protein
MKVHRFTAQEDSICDFFCRPCLDAGDQARLFVAEKEFA